MIKDIENQTVQLQWNSRGKKRYTELGYTFTKMGDYFDVKVKDLSRNSHKKIIAICDYCGEELLTEYRDYCKRKDNNEAVTCHKCFRKKGATTCLTKYGADNPSRIKEFQDKRNQTFEEKFGGNPFANEQVKQKIKQQCIEKYGVEYNSQVKEFQEKKKQTCIDKYGYNTPSKADKVKQKAEETNVKRYGAKTSLLNSEIRRKGIKTMLKNGRICKSKAEVRLYNLIQQVYGKDNCDDSQIVDGKLLDIVLYINGNKIDIEYDGSYWHQNKNKDINRDIRLRSRGYKILRVKGNYQIPTQEQLKNAIDYLVDNHSKTTIILDIK